MLTKILYLWGDFKHHKVFGAALSLLNDKSERDACREAIQRYKHLFDIAELQLKSADDVEEVKGVKRSDSIEY